MRGGLGAALLCACALGCLNGVHNNAYVYSCAADGECPPPQTCGADGRCHSSSGADAGPDAGPPICLTATTVNCGHECAGLAIGDFNQDGHPDLVVSNGLPDAGSLALLLGRGDGTFLPPKTSPLGFQCLSGIDMSGNLIYTQTVPEAFDVADLNGDGWPDLALSVPSVSSIAMAFNNRDGGFVLGPVEGPTGTCTSAASPHSQMLVLHLDGGLTLATVGYGFEDPSATYYVVALSDVVGGDGGPSLGPLRSLALPSSYTPLGMAAATFQPHQLPGLATATNDGNATGFPGVIELFAGQGDGFSSTAATYRSADGTQDVRAADLNGDGLPDLVTADLLANTITVLYALDGGGFATGVSFSTFMPGTTGAGDGPVSLAIADLDGDGRLDVATVNNQSRTVSILKGLQDGGFLTVLRFSTANSYPQYIQAAHLRGDGGPDLVVSYDADPAIGDVTTLDVFLNTCVDAG